jgi:hypothetical protein
MLRPRQNLDDNLDKRDIYEDMGLQLTIYTPDKRTNADLTTPFNALKVGE